LAVVFFEVVRAPGDLGGRRSAKASSFTTLFFYGGWRGQAGVGSVEQRAERAHRDAHLVARQHA
jgi:hypothetical protein